MEPIATLDRRLVAVGDHAVVALVIAAGFVHHRGLDGLFAPVPLVGAVGPFVAGYLVASLLLGVAESGAPFEPARSLRTATGAWFAATGLGLVVRSSPFVPGGVRWPFGLVVLGSGALALLAWRLLVLAAFERPVATPN